MRHQHAVIHYRALDFWMARAAVLVIICLQLLVINNLSFGPRWLAPALEAALLLPLSVATAWTQVVTRKAVEDHEWHAIGQFRVMIRRTALTMTAIISVMNCGSLVLLVRALLEGHAGNSGTTLLIDALNIWVTNVIVFALWFWSTDRGGPPTCGLVKLAQADFLFAQMTLNDRELRDWLPGFVDYFFLAFTNATAFSPTDTLPLSQRAKLLMMAEAMISLLTIALVAARRQHPGLIGPETQNSPPGEPERATMRLPATRYQYRGRLSETTTSLPPTFWHRLHTSFDASRRSVMKS
ncbi:hypothetical protein HNQ71_004885 [Mesorhizobium sangaii]|uniref:DUF1345 domain-containing protein n=1 Tax=Mesorhizobium sangaii TaxID=505389 RepID=A0A841PV14_9HYPH|nr:hypothetical protein [Mesorhizobium sangaii]MBB6412195.1 hypothetical protein [Mesorhizobium sangaii]